MGGGVNCAEHVSDLNNLTVGQTGVFLPDCPNSPASSDYGICIAFGGSSWLWQIAFITRNLGGEFFLRSNINNEGWSWWRKFQAVN